jgi:hypothetical protein
MKKYDTNSPEAGLIYETLMKHYPAELKKIQMKAANDMAMNGYISKKTDEEMDELMQRIVDDNKRLGRT